MEERLSEETTPITFKIRALDNFLFDYVDGKYIDSDTLYSKWGGEKNVELRHGKHDLLWFRGLERNSDNPWGVHFDPIKRKLENRDVRGEAMQDVQFCKKKIEVSPYLMPVQELSYEYYVTCMLFIEITDFSQLIQKPTIIDEYDFETKVVGKITGIPNIRSISLDDGSYATDGDMKIDVISVPAFDEGWWTVPDKEPWLAVIPADRSDYPDFIGDIRMGNRLLCPFEGMTGVVPKAVIYDTNGKKIATTDLPRISFLPGCVTHLRGPLFSGTTSDWSATIEEYNNFDWNGLWIY